MIHLNKSWPRIYQRLIINLLKHTREQSKPSTSSRKIIKDQIAMSRMKSRSWLSKLKSIQAGTLLTIKWSIILWQIGQQLMMIQQWQLPTDSGPRRLPMVPIMEPTGLTRWGRDRRRIRARRAWSARLKTSQSMNLIIKHKKELLRNSQKTILLIKEAIR